MPVNFLLYPPPFPPQTHRDQEDADQVAFENEERVQKYSAHKRALLLLLLLLLPTVWITNGHLVLSHYSCNLSALQGTYEVYSGLPST